MHAFSQNASNQGKNALKTVPWFEAFLKSFSHWTAIVPPSMATFSAMNVKYPNMTSHPHQTLQAEPTETWGQLILGTLLTLGSLILVWASL